LNFQRVVTSKSGNLLNADTLLPLHLCETKVKNSHKALQRLANLIQLPDSAS